MTEPDDTHPEAPKRMEYCADVAAQTNGINVSEVKPSDEQKEYASKMVLYLYGETIKQRVSGYEKDKRNDQPCFNMEASEAAVLGSVCTVLHAVQTVGKWRNANGRPATSSATATTPAAAASASAAGSTGSSKATTAAASVNVYPASKPPQPPTTAAKRVFCSIRPPGHHACVGVNGYGFCVVNNVAFALMEAYRCGFRRPAVVDFDLHLGDATNTLVDGLNAGRSKLRTKLQDDGSLSEDDAGPIAYYCSVHMDSAFPAIVTDKTKCPAKCSCLWADGARKKDYYDCAKRQCHRWAVPVKKLDESFLCGFAAFGKSLTDYDPDVLFFSAGFDAHIDEGKCEGKDAGKGVAGQTYKAITRQLLECVGPDVPSVSLLEGGYTKRALQEGLGWHLSGLQDSGDDQSQPVL